jgi:dihydropyrimidine dehydrogenase (NAD+) subunit PreA
MSNARLDTLFCGLRFNNPFVLAAAPSTDSRTMVARAFEAGWSGAVLKTTSVEDDTVVIPYPIMSSLRPGTNMIGMHNIDLISERRIDAVAEDVRWLKQRFPEHRVIMSVVGSTQPEWHYLARRAEECGADLVEASISCPQGSMLEGEEEAQGSMISQDPGLTEKVTRWTVEAVAHTPVYVKLSPAVTDIAAIARAVERGGGQGICAIDSVEAIVGVDLRTFSPLPSVQGYSSHGGYTGRAIKPIGLRCVADIASAVNIPIAGVGGIYDWRDVAEYLSLGASLVQVCTAVMHKGFGIVRDFIDGLGCWLSDNGYGSPTEIVGLALPHLKDSDDLARGLKVVSHMNYELCVRCGLCYVACLDGGHEAIGYKMADREVTVDEELCVGCGLCAQVCPVPFCITIEPQMAAQ